MIFHDLKAIFVHVERTGGVAVRKHLLQHEGNFERWPGTKHFTAEKTKELIDNPEVWENYFKFAIVRNPYDRLVSWYCACRQHPEWNSPIAKYFQSLDCFDDIFKRTHTQILIPQYDIVKGVNFIGRFENYNESMEHINRILGINENLYVKFENSANHKPHRCYYNSFTRATLKKWLKKDFDYFGYEY